MSTICDIEGCGADASRYTIQVRGEVGTGTLRTEHYKASGKVDLCKHHRNLLENVIHHLPEHIERIDR